jgi:hypothetical protein
MFIYAKIPVNGNATLVDRKEGGLYVFAFGDLHIGEARFKSSSSPKCKRLPTFAESLLQHFGEEDLNLHSSRNQHLKPQNQPFPELSYFVTHGVISDRKRLCFPLN